MQHGGLVIQVDAGEDVGQQRRGERARLGLGVPGGQQPHLLPPGAGGSVLTAADSEIMALACYEVSIRAGHPSKVAAVGRSCGNIERYVMTPARLLDQDAVMGWAETLAAGRADCAADD